MPKNAIGSIMRAKQRMKICSLGRGMSSTLEGVSSAEGSWLRMTSSLMGTSASSNPEPRRGVFSETGSFLPFVLDEVPMMKTGCDEEPRLVTFYKVRVSESSKCDQQKAPR